MANFPNSQQARSRLYKSVSSTNYRLALLGLTLFTVFLFSIELGLHKKFLGEVEVSNDLGMTGIGIDAIGMGIMLASFLWSLFLLLWRFFGRSKIHPGYYIGFDFYVFFSLVIGLSFGLAFSDYLYNGNTTDDCQDRRYGPYFNCQLHYMSIRNLFFAACAFGFLASLAHFIFFILACHSARLYDEEKRKIIAAAMHKGLNLESHSEDPAV